MPRSVFRARSGILPSSLLSRSARSTAWMVAASPMARSTEVRKLDPLPSPKAAVICEPRDVGRDRGIYQTRIATIAVEPGVAAPAGKSKTAEGGRYTGLPLGGNAPWAPTARPFTKTSAAPGCVPLSCQRSASGSLALVGMATGMRTQTNPSESKGGRRQRPYCPCSHPLSSKVGSAPCKLSP
jgi:hypothetical protein